MSSLTLNPLGKNLFPTPIDKELFMNLMDLVPSPMYLRSFDGVCIASNKALEQYLEFSREEILYTNIEKKIYGEEDEDFSRDILDDVLRLHPGSQSFDLSLERNGKMVHFSVFREVLSIPLEEESYILTILVDMTSHRNSEHLLQKSLSILHGVLESSYAGILVLQKQAAHGEGPYNELDIITDNRRFRELFDLSLEGEFTVPNLYSLQQELGLEEIDWFSPASLSDSSIREQLLRLKNGRILEQESLPFFSGGDILGRIWSYRDVTERVQREQQILSDIQLAAKVQRQFLPPSLHTDDIQVEGVFFPSHGVSGDIYHYQWDTTEKRLFGFIIDVSGHGVATALHTSLLLNLGKTALERPETLAKRVAWLNRQLLEWFTDSSFASGIFFEADLQEGYLRTVSAGMGYYLRAGQRGVESCKEPGFLLGMFDQIEYKETVTFLCPNDSYYFLSDGISDVIGKNAMLSEFSNQYEKNLAFIENIARRPERHDDSSAVCIQFNQIGCFAENSLRELLIVSAKSKNLPKVDEFFKNTLEKWDIPEQQEIFLAVHAVYSHSIVVTGKRNIYNKTEKIEIYLYYGQGILEIQIIDEGIGLLEKEEEKLFFAKEYFNTMELKQGFDGRYILKLQKNIFKQEKS